MSEPASLSESRGWKQTRALGGHGAAKIALGRDAEGRSGLLVTSEDAATLAGIADAHARIACPYVPRLLARSATLVVLDAEVHGRLADVVAHGGEIEQKAPYPVGIAFNEMLMDALEAAHDAPGGPHCLGAVSWEDVILGRDGRPQLLAFGFGVDPRYRPGACRAPETVLGAPPTPASDVYLVHAMLRSLLPHLELIEPLSAAAAAADGFEALREALVALDRDALAAEPGARPADIAALRQRYRAIRELAPSMPQADDAAMHRFFARMSPSSRRVLKVDIDARSIELDGEAIDLSRHSLLWRVLERLVRAHRAGPGTPVDLDAVQEAAWPGEKILPQAARSRIYVAISKLRKRGLREVLLRRDDGYLLDPTLDLHV